jgi:chaperone modulatory protein CbpM
MATKNLISADDVLMHHQLEQTFIRSLQEEGLITINIVDQQTFIPANELPKLETMIHLYRDLDINVAGIASIGHLLQQLDEMQQRMWLLQNRLRRYED